MYYNYTIIFSCRKFPVTSQITLAEAKAKCAELQKMGRTGFQTANLVRHLRVDKPIERNPGI